MGLNASSDEWCCQSDIIIQGLPWARKIVDDTIIWATTLEELRERIDTVLTRCRKSRITISRKKLQVGRSIHFAGHTIADTGIRPDEAKYQAIERFPRPEDTKDLRSFNGLATQLGNFIPDLSHMLSKLRPLLKKDVAWTWTDDHEKDFLGIKKILCSKSIIHTFDRRDTTRTTLLTDASRLHGIGFALMQITDDNQTKLV